VGPHIHEKNGAIERYLAVLPFNGCLLYRVHAAYGRAIAVVAKIHVPRAHTLKPGDFPRFLFIGGPHEMSFERARRGEDSFKFQGCDHVGKRRVGVGVIATRIKGFEPRRHDQRAHIQGDFRFLFIKIDGPRGAEFFTCPALSFLEIDAIILVDDVFEGNGLGIGDVDGFTLDQAFIIDVVYFFGALFSTGSAGDTFVHVHISRVADNPHAEIPLFSGDVFDFAERQ